MFPSSNHFRDIPCPFFSRVGCPRPHCHFKHVQVSAQSNISSNTSTSAINIPPDANETLNKLISQLSSAAAGNSSATTTAAATTNPIPSVDFTSILQTTLLQSLTTVFANALNATTTTNNNNNNNNETPQATNNTVTQATSGNETAPQYRPTPIVELERRRRVQQTVPPNTKSSKVPDFDSDEYVQATFSPPSTSPTQSEPVQETKPTIVSKPAVTQPTSSTTFSKPPEKANPDPNHLWVTPPMRRNLSSDHNDSDERKSTLPKKLNNTQNKPIATVKPNIIEKPAPITNPMLKPIPKKTTTTATTVTSKVRVADIDLDKVPVTSTLSVDDMKKKSTALKRSSNGTNEIPQKKPKINAKTSPATNINRKPPVISNGTNKTKPTDEGDELALFDQAFSTPKPSQSATTPKKPTPTLPPTSVQQFTSRYTSLSNTSSNNSTSTAYTRAETFSDGRRIAHQPKAHPSSSTAPVPPLILQPLVDPNSSVNKIPFKTRQEYLTFFLNELKKQPTTSNNSTPIYLRAQTIEKEIFDKSTNKNSYLNLAAKNLRQLRSEDTNTKPKSDQITPPKKTRLVVSHSAMLTGGNTDNVSFGIKKTKDIDVKTLTDNELYTFLLVYKASERDLMENGYPAFSLDFPDKVLIKNKNPLYNSSVKIHSSDPYTRICCRCSKTYRITKEGEYVQQEQCIYHWGRLISQRVAGQIEKTYSCCSSKANTIGCAVAPYHVHDADETRLLSNYVKTQPLRKPLGPNESYGIYALDCEMCYTINGLELVRVSVVNHKLESVYETLVKPYNKILDYNTRWSGITEQHLRNINVTFEDVQKNLLKLFNTKSILIGHSLESDLKALKIVHETVVDTSLVFPHAKGKPYKRALKTLMAEYLNKIVQENTEGHDSMEDAMSCMELMLWKVKEDLKNSASHH